MNFKKIIACAVCAAMLTSNAFAFTDFLPEHGKDNGTEQSQEEQSQTEENASESSENAPEQSGESDASDSKDGQSNEDVGTEAGGGSFGMSLDYFLNPGEYYYKTFEQILKLYVERHLYETTDTEVLHKMVQQIIENNPEYFEFMVSSMLSTMDPYSSYHEANSHFLNVENAATGFGIKLKDTGDGCEVLSVLEDSNAKKAGLEAGDKFVSVAGYSVKGLPSSAVMTLLSRPYMFILDKNENGKYASYNPECEIVVERGGQTLTFNLTRGSMTEEQITSELTDDGQTAYIIVSSFLGDGTDEKFNDLIYTYSENGVKNLTIDLRDNGGGSLEYALSMAESFLDDGELICYYNERELEEPLAVYSTTPKAEFNSITILVNGNTASAAELFTSILQGKGKAKVVGEKTYGKSIGQTVYFLANGDYITITTYEMLDENMESYNGVGIIPDLEIENVELYYELPELLVFNHSNYTDIKEGVYSDASLALEQRLVVMGLMYESDADGIFDGITKAALRIYQRSQGIDAPGICTYDTVTKITNTINGFKTYTYYEDSQYDVAMIVHRSFSQGKRLVKEKQQLAEKNAQLIKAREQAILDELDAAEAQK